MWEGGPRVSTIMQWPARIAANSECNKLASTIDILPTLAEITGANLPEKKIDGVSILSLLNGENDANPRESFIYYYRGDLIAVRNDNWKLVFPHTYRSYVGVEPGKDGYPGPYGRGRVTEPELYDLEKDISETTNLAALHPEIVEELELIGEAARENLGDRLREKKGKEIRKPGRIHQEVITIDHLAIGKDINISSNYSWQYSGVGDSTVINGTLGSLDFTDEQWLGFHDNDFEAVIDLGEKMQIGRVDCGFLINQGVWIFGPKEVVFSVSMDGKDFNDVQSFSFDASKKTGKQEVIRVKANLNVKAKFIKVTAKSIGKCPEWHAGAGNKAWLFVDEVVVK